MLYLVVLIVLVFRLTLTDASVVIFRLNVLLNQLMSSSVSVRRKLFPAATAARKSQNIWR